MATQTNHPYRAIIRTILEVLIALAVVVPLVLTEIGVNDIIIGGVSVIAVCAAFTRVMALPSVERFLQRFVPWLAAEPSALRQHRGEGGYIEKGPLALGLAVVAVAVVVILLV